MSKDSNSIFAGLGAAGVIGALIAWSKTAAFVGWHGAGLAVLVGAGTSAGGYLAAIPAGLAGVIVAGLTALAITKSKASAVKTATIAGYVCSIAAGAYGAVKGYDFAKEALTVTPCHTTFNNAAQPAAPSDSLTVAKAVLIAPSQK